MIDQVCKDLHNIVISGFVLVLLRAHHKLSYFAFLDFMYLVVLFIHILF